MRIGDTVKVKHGDYENWLGLLKDIWHTPIIWSHNHELLEPVYIVQFGQAKAPSAFFGNEIEKA